MIERKRHNRPNCRCIRGGDTLHGPYLYRRWLDNGHRRRQYVRPADAERVRAGIAERDRCGRPQPRGVDRVRGLLVEEIVQRLAEQLMPLLDRTNRMMLRNLKALQARREAPTANVSIGQAGQVNVGAQQVNATGARAEEQHNGDGLGDSGTRRALRHAQAARGWARGPRVRRHGADRAVVGRP